MPSKKLVSNLAKSIVSGSYSASGFICATLFELGEIYIETFLNPSYYLAQPSRKIFSLGENWKINRNAFQVGIKRLIDQGLVERRKGRVSLTKEGRLIISGLMSKRKILEKKWDGKYRLVIFDIPEIKKELPKVAAGRTVSSAIY